jgi:4-aminobutyrate aminotransferase
MLSSVRSGITARGLRLNQGHVMKRWGSAQAAQVDGAGEREDLEQYKKNLYNAVSRLTDDVIKSAYGATLVMQDGKKVLDFTSGIGVTATGHCHPKVAKAVAEQAYQLSHGQITIAYHEPMLKLIKKLLPLVPKSLDSFGFFNSGAEAVENAVKLARHATKRQNVIVFQGSFHGRTMGAMSLTRSKTVYSAGFGPLPSGVFVAPYPYRSQLIDGITEKQISDYCLEEVQRLLLQQTAPQDTAAILIEPVLGEGGYVVPPAGFLPKLKEICNKHGILLIADEVQCGFGRTGKMFAVEHFGVTPDILIMAKGIASGYPLSAIATRHELSKVQPPGSMGGTYSGNAVACAAALATIEVFEEENILQNVQARSEQLVTGLHEIVQRGKYPVKEIRGLGLMIGMEFDKSVRKGFSHEVSKRLCDHHNMLLLNTSIFETIRYIPPLNVTKEEVDIALHKTELAMQELF